MIKITSVLWENTLENFRSNSWNMNLYSIISFARVPLHLVLDFLVHQGLNMNITLMSTLSTILLDFKS